MDSNSGYEGAAAKGQSAPKEVSERSKGSGTGNPKATE